MAATRPGDITPFPQGYGPVPRPIPQSVMTRVIAANTAETITPPAGSRYVIFSANVDIFVNCFATATVPAADVTDGTGSELNPAAYAFNTNERPDISVISASAGIVTAAFYA